MTVGQSPAYHFSVSDGQKAVFLSLFRTVLCAIHMQVTDRPSPDAPSLTQAIIVQMDWELESTPKGDKLLVWFLFRNHSHKLQLKRKWVKTSIKGEHTCRKRNR